MFSFFGGGNEKWGMKDEKKIVIGEGVCVYVCVAGGRGGQKPEHFDARIGNGNHICDPPMDSSMKF